MRSSEALSFIGALCVLFGLGLSTYQLVMAEARSQSTWNVPHELPPDTGFDDLKRASPGLIVLGAGVALLLAGALLERRRS